MAEEGIRARRRRIEGIMWQAMLLSCRELGHIAVVGRPGSRKFLVWDERELENGKIQRKEFGRIHLDDARALLESYEGVFDALVAQVEADGCIFGANVRHGFWKPFPKPADWQADLPSEPIY